MPQTAGTLENRIRSWVSAQNRSKLESTEIYELMNEAGEQLVKFFDIWFCKKWGETTRSASNAIWDTGSIPPPRASSGALLSEAQIAAGSVPVNTEYLRALPFPDRLLRPVKVFWGPISNNVELSYLYEDEFYGEYSIADAAGASSPAAYSHTGDSLLFGPTPGFSATVNVQGFFKPTLLEDDDDENEFTRHGPDLLVYTVQDLLILYQYEEETRAGAYRQPAQKALRAALAQSGRVGDVARRSTIQRKG
jgi:hypothetical protein